MMTNLYQIPRYRIQLVRDSGPARPHDTVRVTDPDDITPLLAQYFQGLDREHFVVVMLDVKNRVIGLNTVSIGTLNSSLAHPREIFKPAVLCNAAGVILSHNHPSGESAPSDADIAITKRITKAGDILGINVLDHIIIGERESCSLKVKGLMG